MSFYIPQEGISSIMVCSTTDHWEIVEVIQLVHLYCGADRGRVNATDHEGLLGFADFLGTCVRHRCRGCRYHPGVRLPGWSGTFA